LTDAKAAPAAGDSGAGGRFAELFTGHMLKLERQGLAVAQDGLLGLQMMPLGQTINVITSDAPVPDMQSLLAFAKAQGLDDQAVAGLFGEMPTVPQGVQMPSLLPQGVQVPSLLPQGVQVPSLLPQGVQVPSLLPQGVQVPTLLPEGVFAIGQPTGPTPPVKALETTPSSAQAVTAGQLQALPGVTILGLQLTPASPAQGAAAPAPVPAAAEPAPRAPEAMPIALATALVLAAQAGAHAVRAAEVPPPVAPLEASPPMLDALRVQMGIPGEAITRRLAQMSGSKTSLSWAELVAKASTKADAGALAGATVSMSTASSAGAGPDAALALAPVPGSSSPNSAAAASAAALAASASAVRMAAGPLNPALADDAARLGLAEETVTVEVPAGLDLGALADYVNAPVGEPAGPRQSSAPAAAAQTPQAAADAARAAYQEQAEQTQLLADRMGQALANRLISQIERGQWKLQMRMQPEALGRVEVALDMHAGGLDAVFSTDNALAKDLLGQGAQRLRDALTQSGTTVASVTVHADARGQSGGNSTPQRRQPESKQSAAPAAVGAVPHRAARYTGGVAEGLNVLA
jgi:flagellar hook-length control protein FliK